MEKRRVLLLFSLFTCLLSHAPLSVLGYAGGAPNSNEICEKMIPQHGEPPQTSTFPYEITVPRTSLNGGETLEITISAPSGSQFKGFMAQVKKQREPTKNYGKFNPSSDAMARATSCFGNSESSMTHNSNLDKQKVTLRWTAPNEDLTDLEITTSVAKNGGEYWTHHVHPQRLTVKRDATLTTTPPPSEGISPLLRQKLKDTYLGCDTKGCIGFPTGCIEDFEATQDAEAPKTCDVLLTFKSTGQRHLFNLTGKPSNTPTSTGYIAMGMSTDAKMGQDSVVGCYLTGSSAVVSRFYNPATHNEKADDIRAGLPNPKQPELLEGFLFCEFEQTSHTVNGISINMDNNYHYLLARGSQAGAGGLGAHDLDEMLASSEPIHVAQTGIQGAKNNSRLLYQLHGAFMIVAWLVCASTGMFTARYYKLTHTGVMPMNKAFWFVVHVFCMFSTAFLTVCGAVFILIKKEKLQFTMGDDLMWHPILGVILFGLAIFQVLIAFLRPHPGTKRRPLFNWIHWTVGNSAHIIGIACIFLANDLVAANLDKSEYMFVMMGAVLFHVVMHLVMSFHTLWADGQMDAKTRRAVVPGPMKPSGASGEAPGTGFRSFMLFVYFIGLLGCAAALIYFVCGPLESKDS